MKFLINNSFKAVRTGEYVRAAEDAGEFILNTEDQEALTLATLSEIAKKNGLKSKETKKKEVLQELETHLINLELPKMSKKPESQSVEEIIIAGVAAGKSDDDMLIEIVMSGIGFKKAGKMFAAAMAAGGYRITAKERKEKGRGILVDAEFAPKNYDEISEMIEKIVKEIDDTNPGQANSIIKSYAKEFEIELPKPEKKAVGGFRSKAQAWMIKNPEATKEDLSKWLASTGKKDPEGKLLGRVWGVFEFGKAMRAA